MTRSDFSVALTRALHQVQLSHPTYVVLVVIASGKARSVAGISAFLGIAYHSVVWHMRQHPALFVIHRESIPHAVELSAEGAALLHKVESLVARYVQDDHAGGPCVAAAQIPAAV